MLAWSLLLVCGLRLHRWSDRAVAGMAVAGMRPARRRCSTTSPRPCSCSSRLDSAEPDWAAQLCTVARDCRELALAHPHVVPLLVTRPLATPLRSAPSAPCAARRRPDPAYPRRLQQIPAPCTPTWPCSGSRAGAGHGSCRCSRSAARISSSMPPNWKQGGLPAGHVLVRLQRELFAALPACSAADWSSSRRGGAGLLV
jgi:hypothetical protein